MEFRYGGTPPPSLNELWSNFGGVIKLTPEAREFRLGMLQARIKAGLTRKMHGKLFCKIRVCMRDRRKRDLDSFLKGTLDSLTGTGVIEDDSQIVRIEADKCDCMDCPTSFFLLVRELENEGGNDKKGSSSEQGDLRPSASTGEARVSKTP